MSDLLEITNTYLKTAVAPVAAEIDRNPEALKQAWRGLGKLGVLSLRVPPDPVTAETFALFTEQIARYSGALAFLQTQHQSAAGMLSLSNNCTLQQQYLSGMKYGTVGVGIGFSQLRRSGKPMVTALEVKGGFKINGTVPWVTGWNIFDQFILAASLPDGRAVFAMVPFEEIKGVQGDISLGAPMSLCAMTGTNTVTVTLTDWFLSSDLVVSIQPVGWIQDNDHRKVLQPSFFALGCARAGLDIVERVFDQKQCAFIGEALESLSQELGRCRGEILAAVTHGNYSFSQQVQLRGRAIALGVKCAHAAVTVSSGSANLSDHPASRVYREALLFTVSGQTQALMQATLENFC